MGLTILIILIITITITGVIYEYLDKLEKIYDRVFPYGKDHEYKDQIKYIQKFLYNENVQYNFTKCNLFIDGTFDTDLRIAIEDYIHFRGSTYFIDGTLHHLLYTEPTVTKEMIDCIQSVLALSASIIKERKKQSYNI